MGEYTMHTKCVQTHLQKGFVAYTQSLLCVYSIEYTCVCIEYTHVYSIEFTCVLNYTELSESPLCVYSIEA